jgi:hypothetical protein
MDVRELVDRLSRGVKDRKQSSFYLSQSLLKEFKRCCKKIEQTPSKVVEEFMGQFIDAVKSKHEAGAER